MSNFNSCIFEPPQPIPSHGRSNIIFSLLLFFGFLLNIIFYYIYYLFIYFYFFYFFYFLCGNPKMDNNIPDGETNASGAFSLKSGRFYFYFFVKFCFLSNLYTLLV
jgi:hypothetical protein